MQARTEMKTKAKTDSAKFKVGDKAVYPAQGVAEIVAIEEKDIAGRRQQFYVLKFLEATNTQQILVPVNNPGPLRKPVSESEIREMFAILKERTVNYDTSYWNRRSRVLREKINTGSLFDIAEVVRDLYRTSSFKRLSDGETGMLKRARALIVKEVAVARGKSEEKVLKEIEKIFATN